MIEVNNLTKSYGALKVLKKLTLKSKKVKWFVLLALPDRERVLF